MRKRVFHEPVQQFVDTPLNGYHRLLDLRLPRGVQLGHGSNLTGRLGNRASFRRGILARARAALTRGG